MRVRVVRRGVCLERLELAVGARTHLDLCACVCVRALVVRNFVVCLRLAVGACAHLASAKAWLISAAAPQASGGVPLQRPSVFVL